MGEREEIKGWLSGRMPKDWEVTVGDLHMDPQEVLVTLRLKDVESPEGDLEAARIGRIQQFREDTRDARITISQEAHRKYGRILSWGAECGEVRQMFTHLALPVMTRLRIAEREVLDALVASGIARSRAHAPAKRRTRRACGPSSPRMVSGIEVHGKDTFTNEEIFLRAPDITAELKGDPTTNERDRAGGPELPGFLLSA